MSLNDLNAASGSLDNMNALFPTEYKVEININKYEKLMESRVLYICKNCKAEINNNKIVILHLIIPLIDSILAQSQTERIWICPECKKENQVEISKIIHEKMAEPYYLKVIPKNPIRGIGIADHSNFMNKFSEWFWNYLRELEYQIGLYRAEYRAQHGEDMENDDTFRDDGKG